LKDGEELYASGQVIWVNVDQNTNTSTGLPMMYFVDTMSDLFHERIPDSYKEAVFDVMRRVPQHTFQVLTKRAERMVKFKIYPHGISV
jgi:protein gp37